VRTSSCAMDAHPHTLCMSCSHAEALLLASQMIRLTHVGNMTRYRVRHEAAEALGAIATDKCECMLRQYEDDDTLEV
jgi:hypothetical protein